MNSKICKMASFNVLENNQAYMAWLGIYSRNLDEPTNEFLTSFASFYVLITMTISFCGSTAFIMNNWSIDLITTLEAFKIFLSTLQCIGSFVNIGLNMSKIRALHLTLQQLVDEGTPNSTLYLIHSLVWLTSIPICTLITKFIK